MASLGLSRRHSRIVLHLVRQGYFLFADSTSRFLKASPDELCSFSSFIFIVNTCLRRFFMRGGEGDGGKKVKSFEFWRELFAFLLVDFIDILLLILILEQEFYFESE